MAGGGLFGAVLRVGQWIGKGVRAARGLIPRRWRGHEWPFLPLIPGKWRALTGVDALQLMVRYAAESLPTPMPLRDGDVLAVRVLSLICVRQGILVEYDVASRVDGQRGIGSFIWRPNRFTPLTGASLPFHMLNEEGALKLDNAASIEQFVQLFAGAVNGEDGSFNAMRIGYPLHVNTAHPMAMESLSRLSAPPNVRKIGDKWYVSMSLAYGSGFFRSSFCLSPEMLIEMEDDECLFGIIPGVVQRWEDDMRVMGAPDMDELNAMPGADAPEEDNQS